MTVADAGVDRWLQYLLPRVVVTRDRLVRDEVGGYVMTVLHQLPLMQPSVVVLRDVHGWAAEEVGTVPEITDADQRAPAAQRAFEHPWRAREASR